MVPLECAPRVWKGPRDWLIRPCANLSCHWPKADFIRHWSTSNIIQFFEADVTHWYTTGLCHYCYTSDIICNLSTACLLSHWYTACLICHRSRTQPWHRLIADLNCHWCTADFTISSSRPFLRLNHSIPHLIMILNTTLPLIHIRPHSPLIHRINKPDKNRSSIVNIKYQ